MSQEREIDCCEHGKAIATYVCKHLVERSNSEWHSAEPDEEDPWPDAWCGKCHRHYALEGEWNDTSEHAAGTDSIKLICHHCYERFKANCTFHPVE